MTRLMKPESAPVVRGRDDLPVTLLQAEAAGIIREAQDFCRQYGSPEELAKYPVASLVLRLAHALKQLADELDRRCPHDPDYEHNSAEVAKAYRQWREAAKACAK